MYSHFDCCCAAVAALRRPVIYTIWQLCSAMRVCVWLPPPKQLFWLCVYTAFFSLVSFLIGVRSPPKLPCAKLFNCTKTNVSLSASVCVCMCGCVCAHIQTHAFIYFLWSASTNFCCAFRWDDIICFCSIWRTLNLYIVQTYIFKYIYLEIHAYIYRCMSVLVPAMSALYMLIFIVFCFFCPICFLLLIVVVFTVNWFEPVKPADNKHTWQWNCFICWARNYIRMHVHI